MPQHSSYLQTYSYYLMLHLKVNISKVHYQNKSFTNNNSNVQIYHSLQLGFTNRLSILYIERCSRIFRRYNYTIVSF